jgi:hypothetical protein
LLGEEEKRRRTERNGIGNRIKSEKGETEKSKKKTEEIK